LFNYEDYPGAVEATLSRSSFSSWTITPPMRQQLIYDLKNNSDLMFTVTMSFFRAQPDKTKSIVWKYDSRPINEQEKLALLTALTTNAINETSQNSTYGPNSVVLKYILPRAYRLPLTGSIKPSAKLFDIAMSLKIATEEYNLKNLTNMTQTYKVSEYWNVAQVRDRQNFDDTDNVQLIVVSQPFVNWIPESIVVAGIISVYSVFVLGLGRFLRIYVTGLSHRAIFEDMPEVDELLEFCTDILLARQDGAPELEEELFRDLVELYRSPEMMIEMTMPKAPRFKPTDTKEKQD